jgi:hypothetical protein
MTERMNKVEINNDIFSEEMRANIKNEIIKDLTPYFIHKDILEQQALSDGIFSVFEYINKYVEDPEFSEGLKQILNYYQNAGAINLNVVLTLMMEYHEEFVNRENIMCSLKQKEIGNEEELYDKIMSYFDYIGTSLEVSVKGIVNELNALICLTNGKKYDYAKICKLDFGVVVNNILEQGYFVDILKIHDLKISDWRNIAKHHSYKIQGNDITCIYGKDKKSFRITYEELLDDTYKITRSSNILNIARCIFVYDNFTAISLLPRKGGRTIEFREKIVIKQITTTLALHGFIIRNFKRKDRILDLEIIDQQQNTAESEFIQLREECYCKILKDSWPVLDVDRINIKYFDREGQIVDALWMKPIS